MKLLFLLALLQVGCATAVAENLKVSSLAQNEEVKIDFVSNGCFSGYGRFFIVSGQSKTMTLAEKRITWDEEKKRSIDLGLHVFGVLPLRAQDLSGLDSLFAFYRTKPRGGCTMVDFIAIEYWRDGKMIGREEFIDESCLTGRIESFEKMPLLREGFIDPSAWQHLREAVPLPDFQRRLERHAPNKAVEPTPGSVTPRATEAKSK